MPAWILDDQPRVINRYDVCATYGRVAGILTHALLCDDDATEPVTKPTANVRCVHMGPPLRSQSKTVDVCGSIGLTEAEQLKIKAFVDDRQLEQKAQRRRLRASGGRLEIGEEYVICPPAVPPSPSQPLWRFSCAGFVLQAYLEADIELLDSRVPSVEMKSIVDAYPDWQDALGDFEVRRRMGIGEGEHWPIVFVGYVIHSLSRSSNDIRAEPYVAKKADIRFPGTGNAGSRRSKREPGKGKP